MSKLVFLVVCLTSCVIVSEAKSVFAHFIVGNAGAYSQDDWAKDVYLAASAGIDGFALNIGGDSYTQGQLNNAYNAAANHGNFKMFISFDYGANPGFSVGQVTDLINTYRGNPGQFLYNGKPLVSTFEGVNSANDWWSIKANTNCFLVPDWTSGKGNQALFDVVDGALSWDIWPYGASDMNTGNDQAWVNILRGKPYMMGVSPWFFTNLPQYNKNWVWRGNQLWATRWQQAIAMQPEFVEIVTWNDFGESHYIGPLVAVEEVSGCEWYVNNNPHDGWRAILPYYINQYKNGGNATYAPSQDVLTWTHGRTSVHACWDGGTTGGPDNAAPSTDVAQDAIDVDVLLTAPADISITIGGGGAQSRYAERGASHFQIPFNGQTGQVVYTLSRNGQQVMQVWGTNIDSGCDKVNFNAITGSQTAGAVKV